MAPVIAKSAVPTAVTLSTSVELVAPKQQQQQGQGKGVVVPKQILATAASATIAPGGPVLDGGAADGLDSDADDELPIGSLQRNVRPANGAIDNGLPIGSLQTVVQPSNGVIDDGLPIGSLQTFVQPPNEPYAVVNANQKESSTPPILLGLRTDAPASTSVVDNAVYEENHQVPAYTTTGFGTAQLTPMTASFGGSKKVHSATKSTGKQPMSPNPKGDKDKKYRWVVSDDEKAAVIKKIQELQTEQGGYVSRMQGIKLFVDLMPGMPPKSAANHLDRLRRMINPATGEPFIRCEKHQAAPISPPVAP